MQVARHLGKTRETETLARALAINRNVFDPSVGFMREKNSDGDGLRPLPSFAGARIH